MADNPSSIPASVQRPLSPHLQIYKPQISSVLSITHRITGVGLVTGLIAIVGWLWALAYSPDCLTSQIEHAHRWYGVVFLMGVTFSYFYHLCNGIRHLFWDIGKGFSIPAMTKSGWAVVLFSLFFTVSCWWAILKGGAQ